MAVLATKYLNRFSLSQVHVLATFVILFFTVVFAFLLIQEEYRSYVKQLNLEYTSFKVEQSQTLKRSGELMSRMMSFELEHPTSHTLEAVAKIPALFLNTTEGFVQLFNKDGETLLPVCGLKNSLDEIKASADRSILTLRGLEGKPSEDALVYITRLKNGHTLVSGIYTRTTEEIILERHHKQKSKIIKIVLEIATLAFILFGVIFGINKIINAMMRRDIDSFLRFFERAAHNDQVIVYNQLFFREFKIMGQYANEMVDTISDQKVSLKELNISLEEKVEEKTKALIKNNKELAEAEHFSQKLLDSQKLFLRHAVHETNTPLSVIVTNIDLYTMKYGKNKQLSKIDAAVKNIFNIYDDLSYLVKKGQVEYPKMAIDLNVFIRSRVEFFDEVATQSRLAFSLELSEGDHYVYFNETKLQRIIDNNITNAIKYTLVDETIYVETSMADSKMRFAIFSHSKKIDDTNKVLEPYYREDGHLEGFGIGLNLVKSICDEENVDISIVSIEEETRFSYLFDVMAR